MSLAGAADVFQGGSSSPLLSSCFVLMTGNRHVTPRWGFGPVTSDFGRADLVFRSVRSNMGRSGDIGSSALQRKKSFSLPSSILASSVSDPRRTSPLNLCFTPLRSAQNAENQGRHNVHFGYRQCAHLVISDCQCPEAERYTNSVAAHANFAGVSERRCDRFCLPCVRIGWTLRTCTLPPGRVFWFLGNEAKFFKSRQFSSLYCLATDTRVLMGVA